MGGGLNAMAGRTGGGTDASTLAWRHTHERPILSSARLPPSDRTVARRRKEEERGQERSWNAPLRALPLLQAFSKAQEWWNCTLQPHEKRSLRWDTSNPEMESTRTAMRVRMHADASNDRRSSAILCTPHFVTDSAQVHQRVKSSLQMHNAEEMEVDRAKNL